MEKRILKDVLQLSKNVGKYQGSEGGALNDEDSSSGESGNCSKWFTIDLPEKYSSDEYVT